MTKRQIGETVRVVHPGRNAMIDIALLFIGLALFAAFVRAVAS